MRFVSFWMAGLVTTGRPVLTEGMSRKNSPPFSPSGDGCCDLHPVHLSSGEAVGSPRMSDRPSSWRFELDGFMTPWSFDAFGSGSYASRRVGISGPTMVLSETRGLQLFWVIRGGIRCIWRLGAERQQAGPNSLMDTLPQPERGKNRLASHRVSKPEPAWLL